MDGVVHPAAALLHAHAAPLGLRQKAALGRILGDVLGQDDVPEQSVRRSAVRRRSTGRRARDQERGEQQLARSRRRASVWAVAAHRYSNSSSKYFSEYSMSWAVMLSRSARGSRPGERSQSAPGAPRPCARHGARVRRAQRACAEVRCSGSRLRACDGRGDGRPRVRSARGEEMPVASQCCLTLEEALEPLVLPSQQDIFVALTGPAASRSRK